MLKNPSSLIDIENYERALGHNADIYFNSFCLSIPLFRLSRLRKNKIL